MLDKLRDDLCDVINNSNLPIDAVYYVIKDILFELEGLHDQYKKNNKRQEELEKQKEEENSSEDKKDQS